MILDLVKCGMCGAAVVINEGRRHVCDICRIPEHELYTRIRTLILENPRTAYTIRDAADILEVDESKIQHLVRSGFFKLTMRGIQLS